TKVSDSATALQTIAPLIRADTTVLCVQNGLYSENIAKAIVGERCLVLRAITNMGAVFETPGVVELKVASTTLVERSRPPTTSVAIAEALTAAGLDGRVSDNIKYEMWQKLIVNCVINPINAITRTEVGAIATPGLLPLKRLI